MRLPCVESRLRDKKTAGVFQVSSCYPCNASDFHTRADLPAIGIQTLYYPNVKNILTSHCLSADNPSGHCACDHRQ